MLFPVAAAIDNSANLLMALFDWYCLSFRRDDFQPVSIRVGDEIDTHSGIFKANAAHLLMQTVGSFEVIRAEGQMELALAQIIGLGMILQPSQFQLKIALVIAHINDDEAVTVLAALFVKAQCFLIESQRLIKVGYIVIFVNHLKIHKDTSHFKNMVYMESMGCVSLIRL